MSTYKALAMVVAHHHTGKGYEILSGEHTGTVFCARREDPVTVGDSVAVQFCPDDQYAQIDPAASDDNEDERRLNAYEQKQEDRRERYRDRAANARGESSRAYQAARSILNVIPMGQPVLVGHHSERRHRRDLDRVDSSMRKSIDASNRAAYYEGRAESVGRGGVSQDDPDAIRKLREKVAALESARATEKAANAEMRRAAKAFAKREGREPTQRDHLAILDALVKADKMAEPIAEGLRRTARAFPWLPQYGNGNAAEIRRTQKRIDELEKKAADPDRDPLRGRVGGVSYTIEWNKADNRVQIYFPTRPGDAVVERLKSRGFRWARSVAAWQRHASESAWYHAQQVVHHEQNRDITTDEMAADDDGSTGSAGVTFTAISDLEHVPGCAGTHCEHYECGPAAPSCDVEGCEAYEGADS